MATLEELVVQLTAETSGLRAELNNATKVTSKSMKDMEDAVRGFSENSGKDVGFFQTAMATMAGFVGGQIVTSAFNQLKDLVGTLTSAFGDGIQAAIAEEQALTRLANSLAISGNYSRDAMIGLQQFTGAMEQSTGVADDVIASNLAMLASLTRLDAEGLKMAQQAALDFSAATGKDLESATAMIAKGINGSTDAFKKMGLTIEESADKTTALNNVVGALNAQFGGAAAGAMQTFQGSLTGLTNSFGNLMEELATSVTKNSTVIAVFKQMSVEIDKLTGSVSEANPLTQAIGMSVIVAAEAMNVFVDAIQAVLNIGNIFIAGLKTIDLALIAVVETVESGLQAFVDLGLGIYSLIGGTKEFQQALKDIGLYEPDFSRTEKSFESLTETIMGEERFAPLQQSLSNIADAGANAFVSMNEKAKAVAPTVAGVKGEVEKLSSSLTLMYQEQLKSFSEGLAGKNLLLSEQIAFEQEQLQLQLETKEITEQEFMSRRADNLAATQAAELAQLDAYYASQKGKDAEYQQARVNLLANQKLAEQKMAADRFKMETEQNKLRQQNFGDTMGTIAQLSKSGNKELQMIGKAAAITQATIDGYAAVQKALASAPPPFNFALAAAVGVVSAMNISKIAGVGIGLNKGGTVPGGGANVDSVPASLTPGEEVVDRSTASKLRDFLDGNNGGGTMHITVSFAGATIIGDVRSSDFGAMVIEAVNEAVEAGKSQGIRGKTA